MLKLRLVAAAAIACAVTLLSSGAAQAYPDCGIALSLNDATLVGGGSFDFKADSGSVDCDWAVTYRGKTRTGSGTSLSGSFDTPKVSKKSASKIVAECTHEATAAPAPQSSSSADVTPAFYSASASSAVQAADVTCPVSATITLLPKGVAAGGDVADNANGLLPNTGGSSFWILVIGGALVVGGAGTLYANRRRHTAR